MGLDMYFTGKYYISRYGDNAEKNRGVAGQISKAFPEMAGYSPQTIEFEIKYWRKANAIHRWFVENLQDGIDQCQETWVDPQHLFELRDLCERVLENPQRANELLPASDGFFFGSAEYDTYYLSTITDTRDWLRGFLTRYSLNDYSGYDFYYQASW